MIKLMLKILLTVILITLLSSCSSHIQDKSSAVRVAFFPNITHSQALVGKAEGLFQKALGNDCKIEWKIFNAGAILVSRKGLEIRDIKELGGKKVAIPQYGNTQDLCLRYLLQEKGLKDVANGGTVDIVQVENPDMKTLLDRVKYKVQVGIGARKL